MKDTSTLKTAKSRQEIANEFGISSRTLKRWLQKLGIYPLHQRLISPKEQNEIYDALGSPSEKNDNKDELL